jgi:hypothetical protein
MRVTRGYHALAADFSLAIDDDELADYLEWLLDGFPEPPSSVRYDVGRTDDDGEELIVLRHGDEIEVRGRTRASFVNNIVFWLNRTATDPAYAVMSHAGGVERDGVACVLPADPESGKTTLTAGLVRAGFSYLSDEAVSFDWETGEIEPYPKPLSIDPGSQFLFPELRPPLVDDDSGQWQVPPLTIRPDSVGTRCRARFVVFPKYTADAPTRFEPLSRGEALVEMAKNTFKFSDHSRRALDALAEVIREVECRRLVVGDLDAACELIDELMDSAR